MRLSTAVSALATTVLLTSGCSAFSDDSDDGRPRVAAAFYPLAYVSERVAGDHAAVDVLTQPGGEAHDLELDVQTTAFVAEADLVVYEGGFQPAVDEAVEQNAEGETLDAADVVDLLAVDESPEEHAEHGEDEHATEQGEHAEEEGGHAEEAEAHHGHEHEHGDEDPHFWHDPLRMADLGDAVAQKLAEIDPDHAASYEANAAELRADLEALDAEFVAGLADCERDTVVVSHDAFGYLEKYGLHFAPIAGLSPDAEPSPAHLGELQELIRTEGITTVFSERIASPALSESLAGDLGIETGVLDPVEGLTDETSGEDYLSLMRQNLEALRAANGCP
ncbi:metal ABC transporter substrate-binding protein [Nocardioides sp. SYSU DS0651]|uniref:metal ABC transporter substrate-binding protein n=1 Tax=Nocardioides sp. SYSU DS0651 TaxID=3415955 RepID=UPI003F4C6263